MKGLTDRQKEVLDFISTYTKDNVCPPTVREIGAHFGISLRAVQDHIAALQKKGFLSQSQKKSRSIRVLSETKLGLFTAKVPILGTITASNPLLSEENFNGYINLAEPIVRPDKTYFAIKVRGQSMINAGILEGDIAVIEQTAIADDGQIVVAVLDNAITLRRFYKEADRIRLQPENSAFEAIYCQNVEIAGVLVTIVRTY